MEIKYGLIHCHSENSLKDSTLTPTALVERAAQMGAPAVTLTDHGTLTGIFEFVRAAKENNIKAIPGVEAYVQEDGDIKRAHLLLLAKDYRGYQAVSRAVTASNNRINGGMPCMNMEILQKYFGEGAPGHGKVIATSACVGGVLAQILLRNSVLQDKIDKIQAKASKLASPNDPSYLTNRKLVEEHHSAVEALMAQRDELKKEADRKFGMRERALSRLTGEAYEAELKKLTADKKKSQEAADELAKVKSDIAKMKRRETAARQACKEAEKDHEKWSRLNSEIETLQSGLAEEATLYAEAKAVAEEYGALFGRGNFYIELQYHTIPDEATVMPKLAQIAKELGLPVVAANDVHFAEQTTACIRARQIVMSSRFDKWPEARSDDGEYYIKSDEQLRQYLRLILDEQTVDAAFAGITDIVTACNVEFPEGTHFPKFQGGITGETAEGRLRRLTEEGIKLRYPNQEFKYRKRVEYELDIINKMHYTDYLCIVQDYLDYGRKLGKSVPEGVGYAIGPGRGSAAGSLVCYLIGITSVDPMPLGLLFERFLNPDRVSSPDIDADLSDEVRGPTLEYVKAKYGEEAVCCIMTKGRLKAKAALKAAAKARGLEQGREGTFYYDLGNSLAKIVGNDPYATLSGCEEELRSAFPGNKEAQGIIDDAFIIEGAAVSYGMHAAGVIIADNGDVGEYIPLMWNSKNEQWCTSCDMVEAEAQAGLLKFDFLGLKNLDIITETLRMIKQNTGKSIDIEQVPQEAAIYREIFAKGKTDFIFQFESDGMKNLLRKFQPENLEHLILLNALFRPGPLQYADAICEIKRGKKKPAYICEQIKEVLSVTYSYPVYQEQIMSICNKVAGFTLGEADLVRRFMSKKKADKLAKFQPKFIEGLVASGVERQKAEAFWDELMDFAKYAFNKSHSAVYATIAYYTAWLKYHYPTEYMAATLNWTSVKELPAAVAKCRDMGLKVLPPDINRSELKFTGRDKEILFGLGKVKHVGASSAEPIIEERKNGVFRSFKDLLARVNPRSNVLTSLIDAGALDCWCSNRAALKLVAPNLMDDLEKVHAKTVVEQEAADALRDMSLTKKERDKLEKKLDNAKRARSEYQERFDCTIIPISLPEDKTARLAAESELLGMYVSGHPLDEYPEAFKLRTTSIAEMNPKNRYVTVAGVIKDIKIKNRKSDGKPMAFFKIEDETDCAEGCCFTRAYESIGNIFTDNAVIVIEGQCSFETDDETGEVNKKVNVEDARILRPKPKKILISVYGIPKWTEVVYPQLTPYLNEGGAEVVVYDKALGEFRKTNLRLSKEIIQADIAQAEISEVDI